MKVLLNILFISSSFLLSDTGKSPFHTTYANSSIIPNIYNFMVTHNVDIWEDERYTNITDIKFEYLGEDDGGIYINLPYTFKTNDYDRNYGFGDIEIGLYFINADKSEPLKPQQIWTQGETESNSVWFPTIFFKKIIITKYLNY